MAFLPNIPASTDQLSVSQGQIQNNFMILGNIAGGNGTNSFGISTAPGTVGFAYLLLNNQGATPPAGTAFGANVALYGSVNATTTRNEVYVTKTLNSGVAQIPLTGSVLGASSPAAGGSGWTFLPSGLLMMWGNGDTGSTVDGFTYPLNLGLVTPGGNVPVGFPVFSTVYNVQVTGRGSSATFNNALFQVSSIVGATANITQWRMRSGNPVAPTTFWYLAIGIPASY